MHQAVFCNFFGIFSLFHARMKVGGDGFIIEGVSVLLRHGDRTPETYDTYPKDPHINRTYPEGFGALTQRGKMQAYERGVMIRGKYRSLMSGKNDPSVDIVTRTTNITRTNTTAQYFLGGMFQKDFNNITSSNFQENLIPSPYMYTNYYTCDKFQQNYRNILHLPEVSATLSGYESLYKQVFDCAGINVTDIFRIFVLAGQLQAQEAMNLELLSCAKKMEDSGEIKNASLYSLKLLSYIAVLRKLNGGQILRNITNSMDNLVKNRNGPKIFLYSGHDTNIAGVIHALGIELTKVPYFSSVLVIELYEKGHKHFVKILYYPDHTEKYDVLKLKNCDVMCPLECFKKLINENIPSDEDMSCEWK